MEQYAKHCFFVDAGVTSLMGNEVSEMQRRFGFSEDMRRLLLIQSYSKATRTAYVQPVAVEERMQWYTLDAWDEALDVIERNEDCILSDFLFVFAQDAGGNQYAEITKGAQKGQIVWLNAHYYADVDSLEELIEEYQEGSRIRLDDEMVFQMLYTSQLLATSKASSLALFLC